MATVRARYEKGVLTPLEPLDLEEGKEVVVSVQDDATAKEEEDYETKLARFKKARGGLKDLLDDDFVEMIYESRITGSRHYPRD